MKEPQVYIAFAPDAAGLTCALMLLAGNRDVYGWYTGVADGKCPMSFFMLENFYSVHDTVFYRSLLDDVYGDWVQVLPDGEVKLDGPIPLPEEMCHELERIQDIFVREWLFCSHSSDVSDHFEWYRKQKLPVQCINIKENKLNRLDRQGPLWIYKTPSLDANIVIFLSQRWSLDHLL